MYTCIYPTVNRILRPTTPYEKRETLLLKYEGTNFYVNRLRAMGPIGPGAKKGRLDTMASNIGMTY